MNATLRAIEQLESWAGLHGAPASCGTGTALRSGSRDIVHFHTEHDADLHLTGPAIQRLCPELAECTAVRLHPASQWVTVHLDCAGDADLLVALVSVALKAHARAGLPGAPPVDALCNLARVDILPGATPLALAAGSHPRGARSRLGRPAEGWARRALRRTA
ncbi:hypothetical protein GXW83_18360 [Streptacidiphilus sp. PB12-B1b]|uniref:luciferase domain-containing protein n=1 Tax=Streptacidiphilus sp. PB12-B1b TaxID=2705012 RepID=UPI0015F8719C|nr:hypothetical protein GXW83_18360 [Streptacidiphilus sp. PB12-B1b]